jgi:hypothetical protein
MNLLIPFLLADGSKVAATERLGLKNMETLQVSSVSGIEFGRYSEGVRGLLSWRLEKEDRADQREAL